MVKMEEIKNKIKKWLYYKKIKLKNKYKKYKRKYRTKRNRLIKKIKQIPQHLYIIMSYIKYVNIVLKWIWRVLQHINSKYSEYISEYVNYFTTLLMYITLYGVILAPTSHFITLYYEWKLIPINIWSIYTFGVIAYLIKEELPRVIRNMWPIRRP